MIVRMIIMGQFHFILGFLCANQVVYIHSYKKMLTQQGKFLVTVLHRQVLIELIAGRPHQCDYSTRGVWQSTKGK